MQHIPSWEACRFSTSQEIPRILQNKEVHYRIHKCPSSVPMLSHFDPVHTPTSHFLKTQFIIIFPSTPGIPKWSLSLRFPHQNSVYASRVPHSRYMPLSSHSSPFYHPNNIGWGFQIMKLLIIQLPLLPSYLIPLRPKYSPQHPILKHPQPAFLPQCQRPSFTSILQNQQN